MARKKKFGLIALVILFGLSLAAALYPSVHPKPAEGFHFDTGTLAWMLSASGLVLLMTPGLSFFLRWYG